ncbi:MAG TPA: Spy/CpxP family protein refolding chaperone [Rhizomicrobium sp.]
MKSRILVPFLASLALCASAAMAQDTPAPAPGAAHQTHRHIGKEKMGKHHKQMCTDLYARAVSRLSYVETKLALTDRQKPLFERWKKVKLDNAKARADKCAALKTTAMRASVVERAKLHEKMLKTKLANLQAELPSLEALVASLNDEQKHVLDRSRGAFGDRMHGKHGKHGKHGTTGRMHGHHGGFGTNDAPPPPPAN